MGERRRPIVRLLASVALVASLASVGCGSEPLDLTAEQARGFILQQFPQADPNVVSVIVEEDRASAQTEFNGKLVDFLFVADEAGWVLEAVEQQGRVYFIHDLEHISRTMELMEGLAAALVDYYEDHGAYPIGDGPQAREVMVPEYLAEDTDVEDAWGNRFTYFSEDGEDYTLVSFGPDREAGTQDDLILLGSEFGAPAEQGQD
jgi:hypothetical protein